MINSSAGGPWRERGAGTVLVLGIMAVALAMTAMAGLLGQVLVARHRAQAAADLAALAGAATSSAGTGDACRTAARIAASNGARLETCVIVSGGVVRVGATVPVRVNGWQAHAAARAGAAMAVGADSSGHETGHEFGPDPQFFQDHERHANTLCGDARWAGWSLAVTSR